MKLQKKVYAMRTKYVDVLEMIHYIIGTYTDIHIHTHTHFHDDDEEEEEYIENVSELLFFFRSFLWIGI